MAHPHQRASHEFHRLEDVIKWLSPDSFMRRYIDRQSGLETSLVYDFHCGLFCLSNAATRFCIVDRPQAPVFLNLYIILTAESGVTRKSTSVSTVATIMDKFNDRIAGKINIVHTKTTPERLENILAASSAHDGYAHFAFIVSELVTALGAERYNMAMPGLLTDLYDSPESRRTSGTISRGSVDLRNVYGTFLSASTPTWLTKAINPDVIEGGFASRVFFIVSDHPKQRVAWPRPYSEEADDELADQLADIYYKLIPNHREQKWGREVRRFGLTQSALDEFRQWYDRREFGVDAYTTSFDAREDAHLLKLAALFAINEGHGVIDILDIRAARFVIAETVKRKAVELLAYQVNNVVIDAIEKLRTLLVQNPEGIKHSEIVKRMQGIAKAKRVTVILDLMHALGMVRKWQYGHLAQGRPGISWSPQPALKSSDFLQIMLENLEGAA
jgi:hypothetical protein